MTVSFRFNLLITGFFWRNLAQLGRELGSSLKVTVRPERGRAAVLRVVDEFTNLVQILHCVTQTRLQCHILTNARTSHFRKRNPHIYSYMLGALFAQERDENTENGTKRNRENERESETSD